MVNYSMRHVWAIAKIQLCTLWRARGIRLICLFLLLSTLLLPLSIKTDGTLDGYVMMHLTYTLGLGVWVLSLISLWGGCATISREMEQKTIHAISVKPVTMGQLWLGKWMALLLMNVLVLGLMGLFSYASLHLYIRRDVARGIYPPGDWQQVRQTTLLALRSIRSPLPDVEKEVNAAYQVALSKNLLPEHVPPQKIKETLRKNILAQRFRLDPDQTLLWTFPIAFSPAEMDGTQVQTRCDSSNPSYPMQPVEMQVTFVSNADPNASPIAWTTNLLTTTPQRHLLPRLPPQTADAQVSIHNQSENKTSLFFDPDTGVLLRVPVGSFEGNYLRGWMLLFLRLSLFAAIGVTAGALLSFPVAGFITLALFLMLQLSSFVSAAAQVDRSTFVANVSSFGADAHSHGEEGAGEGTDADQPGWLSRGTANVLFVAYRGTWLMLRPLWANDAVDNLGTGTEIPTISVVQAVLIQGIIYPLGLMGITAFLLRRRELGGGGI